MSQVGIDELITQINKALKYYVDIFMELDTLKLGYYMAKAVYCQIKYPEYTSKVNEYLGQLKILQGIGAEFHHFGYLLMNQKPLKKVMETEEYKYIIKVLHENEIGV